MSWVLLVNILLNCYLLGLILTIQAVHYPSFSFIDQKAFQKFESFHMRRVSMIVMLPMVSELIAGFLLIYSIPKTLSYLSLACIVLIWISTTFLSVPKHRELTKGKNQQVIKELVQTNWPRTILWGTRLVLLLLLFGQGA